MAMCSRHPGHLLPGCTYCRTGTEPGASPDLVSFMVRSDGSVELETSAGAVVVSKLFFLGIAEAIRGMEE